MSSSPLSKEEIERLKQKKKDNPTPREKNLRTQFLVAYDHKMMNCTKCGEHKLCYSGLCQDCWVESKL